MRRVVITGMGIVSSLGTNQKEVAQSLRESRSGIGLAKKPGTMVCAATSAARST